MTFLQQGGSPFDDDTPIVIISSARRPCGSHISNGVIDFEADEAPSSDIVYLLPFLGGVDVDLFIPVEIVDRLDDWKSFRVNGRHPSNMRSLQYRFDGLFAFQFPLRTPHGSPLQTANRI